MDEHEELLEAGEAAEYLAKKWKIEHYSIDAFKMLRHRWGLQPVLLTKNASLWRKSDLDKIPKPDRNRPRPGRRKKRGNEDGSCGKSVTPHENRQWQSLTVLSRAS